MGGRVGAADSPEEMETAVCSAVGEILDVESVELHRHERAIEDLEYADDSHDTALMPVRVPQGALAGVLEVRGKGGAPVDHELLTVLAGYAGLAIAIYEE